MFILLPQELPIARTGPLCLAPRFVLLTLLLLLSAWPAAMAEPVRVRQKQGSVHGFLLLRSEDGRIIAGGDLLNVAHGDTVRSRLIFRFRDGSLDDETTVYRQGSTFQLISDHHIQKGPSYPQPLDVSVDVRSGQVVSRTVKDGKTEVKTEHLDMPPDLANGLLPVVLENFPPRATQTKVSFLAADPKPRIVSISISLDGKDSYDVGGLRREALRYLLHVELGGVAGVVAPIIGKQPSDMRVWVADGEVPAFFRFQGALYLKGPLWTMEITSPVWHATNR